MHITKSIFALSDNSLLPPFSISNIHNVTSQNDLRPLNLVHPDLHRCLLELFISHLPQIYLWQICLFLADNADGSYSSELHRTFCFLVLWGLHLAGLTRFGCTRQVLSHFIWESASLVSFAVFHINFQPHPSLSNLLAITLASWIRCHSGWSL